MSRTRWRTSAAPPAARVRPGRAVRRIAAALADVGPVHHLVLAAIDRDDNSVAEYDIARAIRLVTLKLVGYTEVVHTLLGRLRRDASIVLFGGMAKERPYPGSTTVTTINGGVVGLTRTLVEELRPRRVNSIHPGIVGDSPYWVEKPAALERTNTARPRSAGSRPWPISSARRCSCSRIRPSTASISSSMGAGTAADVPAGGASAASRSDYSGPIPRTARRTSIGQIQRPPERTGGLPRDR